MNNAEAKEKLRRRIASDTADLEAIERAEAAIARLSQEETTAEAGQFAAVGAIRPLNSARHLGSEQPSNGSAAYHELLSLTEVVTATIATFSETHAFTKNDLEERIADLYPGFAGKLDSVSSIVWNMANRGQLHTLLRGSGKRPSLYSRTDPHTHIPPSALFDSPGSEYEVQPP